MVFLAIRLFDSEMVNVRKETERPGTKYQVGKNNQKIGGKYAEKISSDMEQPNEKKATKS